MKKQLVKHKGQRNIFGLVSQSSKRTLYLLIVFLVLCVPATILAFHSNSTSPAKKIAPTVQNTKASPAASSAEPSVAAEPSNNTPPTPVTSPKTTSTTTPTVIHPINACNNLSSQYYVAYNQDIKASNAEHQQILAQLKSDYDNGVYETYNDYQSDVDDENARWVAKNLSILDHYNSLLVNAGCPANI